MMDTQVMTVSPKAAADLKGGSDGNPVPGIAEKEDVMQEERETKHLDVLVDTSHIVGLLQQCGIDDPTTVQRIEIAPRLVTVYQDDLDADGKRQMKPDRSGVLTRTVCRFVDWVA